MKKDMPRSTKQNDAMRAQTRTAVLESALELFAQNGYAHTTTRQIAQKAGISTGLMYHYFAGKEALLKAVLDYCIETLNEGLLLVINRFPPGQILQPLLVKIFEILDEGQEFWALFYMLRTQPEIMRVSGDDFRMWTSDLRGLFVSELTLAGKENPELESHLLYSMIEGVIQQYLLDPEHFPLEQVAAEVVARLS